jgi:hypothetical protein
MYMLYIYIYILSPPGYYLRIAVFTYIRLMTYGAYRYFQQYFIYIIAGTYVRIKILYEFQKNIIA